MGGRPEKGQLGLGGEASLWKTVKPEERRSKWRRAKGRSGRETCGQVRPWVSGAGCVGSAGCIKARLRVSAAHGFRAEDEEPPRPLAWGPESRRGKLVASTESDTQGAGPAEDREAGSVQVAPPLLICAGGPWGWEGTVGRCRGASWTLPQRVLSLCGRPALTLQNSGSRPSAGWALGPPGRLSSLPRDVTGLRWGDVKGRR